MSAFSRCGAAVASEMAAVDSDARGVEVGSTGAGGDRTLALDAAAEAAVFVELDALARGGATFTAISEERGVVRYGADRPVLVIDPIDGSLNAKRGIGHHALSIALADGPTMADVVAGYVLDIGSGEVFTAVREEGAQLDGIPTHASEHRHPDGRLELLAIETGDSRAIGTYGVALAEVAFRFRVLGSIAVAICQVAAGRVDAMVNVTACRAVDMAAGYVIARESGAVVSFPGAPSLTSVTLDLVKRFGIAVAASDHGLTTVESATWRSSAPSDGHA